MIELKIISKSSSLASNTLLASTSILLRSTSSPNTTLIALIIFLISVFHPTSSIFSSFTKIVVSPLPSGFLVSKSTIYFLIVFVKT